jgi:hypothetical protein
MWLAQAFSQNAAGVGSKTLMVDRPLADDPIRIVKVMEGVTELKWDGHEYPNKYAWEAAFDAGDDWLRDLSFVIKNVSAKKIVYLNVSSVLFETAHWREKVTKQTSLGTAMNWVGQRPEDALYAPGGRRLHPDPGPAIELAPDQELTVPIENPDFYSALRSSIEERASMSSVTASNTLIGEIFFEDGTKWGGHKYQRPNTDKPGYWITISKEEWLAVK